MSEGPSKRDWGLAFLVALMAFVVVANLTFDILSPRTSITLNSGDQSYPERSGRNPGGWKQPEASANESADERLADYTLGLTVFTAVLAFSTIGLWIVTWLTLRHAQRDSERQTRDMQASLLASRTANRIALETSWAESRAYLVIKSIWLKTYTATAEVEIELANMGRTPASWVELEGNAQILLDRTIRSIDVPINAIGPRKTRWSIDPGAESRRIPCPMEAAEDGPELLKLVMQAMGSKNLVIQGTVRWGTVFGEILESTFFGWITPNGQQYDAAGNKTGEAVGLPSGVETVACRLIKAADDKPESEK